MLKHIVIVHRPCTDGYVSELTSRLYYQINPLRDGSQVVYWGTGPDKVQCLKYLQTEVGKLDPNDKVLSIRLFDLAIEPVHFEFLSSVCSNIEVYDHHLTFKQSWDAYFKEKNLEWNPRLHYDVEHSGAYLAWKYYFPNSDAPLLVQYVEDRDLWRWSLPNSKEINEAIYFQSPPYNEPEKWIEMYFQQQEELFDELKTIGSTMLEAKNKRLVTLYNTGKIIVFEGLKTFTCNAPHIDASDLGNYAVTKKNETGERVCDVALIWRIDPIAKKCYVSVRGDTIGISDLCKKYGGGGHKYAGGFELELDQLSILL